MSEHAYDAIVVGLGAMGSATAYQLARRGQRVLGVDAFDAGHTLGSSHGESRIIRMAYFEHPNYVPLLRRAWELWEELEQESGAELLTQTGGLFIGPRDGDLVSGSQRSAQLHGLGHTLLDGDEIRRRFPLFSPRDGEYGLFEERAGVLRPERCIETLLGLAAGYGAELRHGQPVVRWAADGDGVVVETALEQFYASKLVVTAGAWAGKLLAGLGLPLQPERIPLFWFSPVRRAQAFELGASPIWIWQDPGLGDFFGVPHVDWPGVKVGKHHTGDHVDPDRVDREIHPSDEAPIRAFLSRCIPDLAGPVTLSKVCLYTNTPDAHFIVDRHPELPQVAYAAGFSGHGFKFATVIGEILADLALTGQATKHADFLRPSADRFPRTVSGL